MYYLYYIATQCLLTCVYVFVLAAYLLRNGWTVDLFGYLTYLAPSLSLGGFRQKNLDTGFPPFLLIYSKYFLAKIFEYKILKNAWNTKFRFYKFSNILSFEVEGQSHFKKPLEASNEAASFKESKWEKLKDPKIAHIFVQS